MVDKESASLDSVFHALSDPTRRRILKMLTDGQYTVGELALPFKMSLNAVSKHIKVLEEAGLLTRTRDGRIHRCEINGAPLERAQDLIQYYQRFWENRFRVMDEYLQRSLEETRSNKGKGDKDGSSK